MATPSLDCLGCKTPFEIEIMQLQYLEEILLASGGGGGSGGNVNLTAIQSVAQTGANVVDGVNSAFRVNVVAGGGAGGTSSTFGVAIPGTGTAGGFSDGTNMQMARVFDLDSGGGTQYALGTNLRAIAGGGSVETGVAANPLRVDPTGTTTQPISATALPLPTGASTAALQTQPGVDIGDVTVNNAAGASAVNIQDGGNSITIDATSLPLPTGAATAALQTQPGVDIGDVTVNNGAGASAVNIQDGGNSITVDGTVSITANSSVNVAQLAGTATSVNNGTADAGTLRVTIASNSTGTVIATQATGTNLHTVVDSGTITTVSTVTNVATIGTSVTPGTAAANLGKAEDSVAASGDTGVFALGVANEAQTTLAADGDYIAHSTDTKGNHLVVGNLAHDAVDAGFPVKIGAQARTTLPTAVADADRVNLITNKYGELATVHAIREMRANQVTTITASTSETTIVTAVASFVLDLYGLIVTNTSATAVNVAIKDATAGTTRLNIAVPATETRGFMLPASDGIKQATANNNWTATVSASVSSIIITALTKQTT